MLETILAQEFTKLFNHYPIFVMVNKTLGGWPDRMIQLPGSKVCFVELKIVILKANGSVNLSNFRGDQAAFMAKWQKNGGSCFLLMCVVDTEHKRRYGIIAPQAWRDWIFVPRKTWTPGEFQLYSEDKHDILFWFDANILT